MTGGRAVLFILTAWLGLVVLAATRSLVPWQLPAPQLGLLIVLYLGLGVRPQKGGGLSNQAHRAHASATPSYLVVALAIGYLGDLFGGAPKGLGSLSLGVVMVVARGAASRLDVTTHWHVLLIAAIAGAAEALLSLALSASLYQGSARSALAVVPGTVLATALFAPMIFGLLARVDRRLSPDSRALRMA